MTPRKTRPKLPDEIAEAIETLTADHPRPDRRARSGSTVRRGR